MSIQWLIFICLTVVGSLIYNVSIKLSASNMNAFVFALILSVTCTLAQATVFCVARYGFKMDLTQQMSRDGVICAVAAGCAAALIDVSYFFAMRYGSAVASQTFWTVGGVILLSIVSFLFFNETITLTKAAGILLGIASLFLIVR